jgi:hypothetical protein
MAHYRSARAFAVNPARLKARPCGPRGLTAQRGQARVFHAKNEMKRLADTQPNREQRLGKFTLDKESPIQGQEPKPSCFSSCDGISFVNVGEIPNEG